MSDLQNESVSKTRRLSTIIVMILCGTGSIIFSKLQFQTKAVGRNGDKHYFTKPLWQNTAMFLGMLFCFVFPLLAKSRNSNDTPKSRMSVKQKKEKKKLIQDKRDIVEIEEIEDNDIEYEDEDEIVMNTKQSNAFSMKRLAKLTTAPASCDFLATYLMNIGLMFLPASIWQLLRGSIVVFSAILTVLYRKRKVPKFQWVGVLIVTTGLTLVGCAAIMGPHESTGKNYSNFVKGIGVMLVILAQFIQALQTIIEETLLHDYDDTNPAHIVSFEGLWGLCLCIFISAPIAYYIPEKSGFKEDSIDTFVMLSNSSFLVGITICYVLVILMYNYSGMMITSFSSALLRNIIDGLRTLLIWGIQLVIHYSSPKSGFGEKWTNWSYLELVGFAGLIYGTFVYNKIIKLKCFEYENEVIETIDYNDEENNSSEVLLQDSDIELENEREKDLEFSEDEDQDEDENEDEETSDIERD
ncbi:hypothetical protein M0813_10902 [Anaeramoeba flamelloides]|uniref:EamA domain-containing protein n=1 Tax=Anaeramoeba flamelloides TaxID=1746091 RepID=A0ABQ8X1S1_9EUKA|nr:hypothetical protein M0813_10902 [Anaeramoeba flamelloides]